MESKKWLDLSGKTVIVTGGSSGIGEQMVEDLQNCGAKVAVIDQNTPKEYKESDTLFFVSADIRSKDSVKQAIQSIYNKFNTVDALVNNAGVTRPRILID